MLTVCSVDLGMGQKPKETGESLSNIWELFNIIFLFFLFFYDQFNFHVALTPRPPPETFELEGKRVMERKNIMQGM